MGAVSLLASGWHREQRAWWMAAALSLALAATVVLCVQGVFGGLQRETDDRVGDLFVGDARMVQGLPGVNKARPLALPGPQAEAGLRSAGAGHPVALYESQFILSRRSLLESVLDEQDQYTFGAPGTPADAEGYGIGVMVGLPTADRIATAGMAQHMLVGTMPGPSTTGAMEVAISDVLFKRFLSPAEVANLSAWPPTATEVSALHFEITAARIDEDAVYKDIVRRSARVVGLYHTELDMIDGYTALADIGGVRQLNGAGADEANAIIVHGAFPDSARSYAQRQGWSIESREAFSERYLGQVVVLVQWLAVVAACSLLVLPFVLVWNGLQQLLDRCRREVAVCRAIGVPGGTIRGALGVLVARMTLIAAAVAAILVGLVIQFGGPWLEGWQGTPFPLGFGLAWLQVGLVLAVSLVSIGGAFLLAVRRQGRENLASSLRSP